MRIRTALAAAALVGVSMTPAPAQAAGCGADGLCVKVLHAIDNGYDRAIIVKCANGVLWTVGEGYYAPCKDTVQVCVRAGEEVWTYNPGYGYRKTWDATGCHDSGRQSTRWITVQRD